MNFVTLYTVDEIDKAAAYYAIYRNEYLVTKRKISI